jgi:hypothetical protein
MVQPNKELTEMLDVWGAHFARAYAEFVRALSQEPFITGPAQPTSAAFILQEATDPAALNRARKSHREHLASPHAPTIDFDPAIPAKTAGQRLKLLLKSRGLKQSEIARRLGVAPSVISRVLKYPQRSRLGTIQKIAKAAGIPLGELIG